MLAKGVCSCCFRLCLRRFRVVVDVGGVAANSVVVFVSAVDISIAIVVAFAKVIVVLAIFLFASVVIATSIFVSTFDDSVVVWCVVVSCIVAVVGSFNLAFSVQYSCLEVLFSCFGESSS